MSLSTATLIYAGIYLAVLLVQGLALWQGGRLARIRGARLGPALLACLLSGVLCLLVSMGITVAGMQVQQAAIALSGSPLTGVLGILPHVVFLLQSAVAFGCVRLVFRASWTDSLLAMLIMVVSGYAANYLATRLQSRVMAVRSIDTPAMAPGLQSVHTQVTCPKCAYRFSFSMLDRLSKSPRKAKSAFCPQCGAEVIVGNRAAIDLGDRILVDCRAPLKRWDTVAVRSPKGEAGELVARIVGLPGESLEMVGGSLFINSRWLQKTPGECADLWLTVHDTRDDPVVGEADSAWRATGKPSRWKRDQNKFVLSAAASEADPLVFTGRLDDQLSYNDHPPGWKPDRDDSPPVGNVRIECRLEQFTGGIFGFRWDFRQKRVSAVITASGEVDIVATQGTSETLSSDATQTRAHGVVPGGPAASERLVFAVRDGVAYLLGQGKVVASLPLEDPTLEKAKRRAEVTGGVCRLQLLAARCAATLSRIVVARDVYFRTREEISGKHETGIGSPNHPVTIPPGHYFVLGDNSLRSNEDSRFNGPVDAHDIQGVVRGVFWPPARWREFP